MKLAIIAAALIAVAGTPAAAQTHVHVSVGARLLPVHGRMSIGAGHARVVAPGVVVVRRHHHYRVRGGTVIVVRPAPPRGYGRSHVHHRHPHRVY